MQKYTITNQATGEECTCTEGELLLKALCKAGIGKHGCNGGGCGICKVEIQSGNYEVVKKMSRAHISPQEEEANTVLSCCVVPHGNLTIRWTQNQQ